jgi:transcriptional regulator with XRE-family HTH domain
LRQERTFAGRLKESLKRSGTSQAGLARLAEVDQSSISRYLRGQCEPNLRQFRAIAIALGLKPAELLPDEPMPDPLHHAVRHNNGDHVYLIFKAGMLVGEWRGSTLDCFKSIAVLEGREARKLLETAGVRPNGHGRRGANGRTKKLR